MDSIAINVVTGRPTKWPRHPWFTGTDHAEFECVWQGNWYRLLSLSQHLKQKIKPGFYLIVDRMYHERIVPQNEVHISRRIG